MTDEKRYTIEQAAAKIGFRPDDLTAMLPDAGIDLAAPGHAGNTLSETEVVRLNRLVERIKQLHDEGPYNSISD